MNRAERRRLQKLASKPGRLAERIARDLPKGKPIDTGSITLEGGPMDGWVVKPNADALQPDWWPRHLEELARDAFEKTRQVGMARGVPEHELPTWDGLTEAKRAEYVQIVRDQKGDGRYVQYQGSDGRPVVRWQPA